MAELSAIGHMTKFCDLGRYYKRVFENENMPQYDDSFMFDDSVNQRRNKRSYRVSRKGLLPDGYVGSHGTYVLKNNAINGLKNHDDRVHKSYPSLLLQQHEDKCQILSSHDIYHHHHHHLKNNNYYAFAPGKSLEDLATNNNNNNGHYFPIRNGLLFGHGRGKSLQNLHHQQQQQQPPKSVPKYSKNSAGFLLRAARSKDSVGYNHYVVNGDADKKQQQQQQQQQQQASKRLYETNNKLKEKAALKLAARILESGVYRQLGKTTKCEDINDDSGFGDDANTNGLEVSEIIPSAGSTGSSGHKASFRSANKLARRARSFKEDLLERISAMRSPGTPNSALPSLRSQSPLSPKNRTPKNDDPESNPVKDLETLVRQIKFDLKHFSDVITKKKLEMLPGNGTIVLETITNIHNLIIPYVSTPSSDMPSSIDSAQTRLCYAVADLIKLCDESMINGEDSEVLNQTNVLQITSEVQQAVEDLAMITFEKMSGNDSQTKSNGAISKDSKNLKLQVRPAIDSLRNTTNEGQRNSLPDIPLTPRERQLLEGTGNGLPIRNSHSTESILDTITTTPHQEPPPKPPIPIRIFDIAPPLPPKRKPNDNNISHLSAVDRVSLQSHSSGSLDSMLNVSNDEEIRAIMDRNSINLDDSIQNTTGDGNTIFPTCINSRLSQDSNSTICTTSSTGTGQNRLSNEIVPQQLHTNNIFLNESIGNQYTNHNRLSSESGFVSMGNNRTSDISYSSFNASSTQNTKYNLSYIDSTPTPGDMTVTLLSELSIDDGPKIPSPNIGNIVQQSVKQVSTSKSIFEQSSKYFSSNESNFFSHSSSSNTSALDMQKTSIKFTQSEQSTQSIVKTQKNVVHTTIIDGSNVTNVSSNVSNMSSSQSDIKISEENNASSIDITDCSMPPALPVKTRKQEKFRLQAEKSFEQGFPMFTVDDQIVELRDRVNACALHGQQDGVMQRPHTLMDQSLSSGQPPPLPMKKKHMFQSVAYSVMAYMEMFGNCSHSEQNSMDFLRHSLHEHHQHSTSARCMSSIQQLSNPSLNTVTSGHTLFHTQNGQAIHGFNQNGNTTLGYNLANTTLAYNQQLTQSHTLHHFNTGNGHLSHQNLSGFSSPIRSPRLSNEDTLKSDTSSITSVSTNCSIPAVPPSPILSIPPALPPKRTKLKQTPNQSPAKPPLSPKPQQLLSNENSSPLTPGSLSTTPILGSASISPAPQFQFDPPSVSIDAALLLNTEDEQWQPSAANKPGKFPVDDVELEQCNVIPSSTPKEAEVSLEPEVEGEPDLVLEMDVSSKIIWKQTNEEGPDIRGGHPDALIVQAIKSSKDFSYQEAFLTTYRTFVSPLKLIEKLRRRHAFLVKHGKFTKAREVQSLLTRVVGDLTIADLDEKLLLMIMDFIYGLVKSVNLSMAKMLRVMIIEKYNNKKFMMQQQQLIPPITSTAFSARSLLEQKAESIAEQMTLLDADLFTKIPAPEALLWARDQCEERSPNLTRFTEHFNKMSYWARSRILEQNKDAREREKYVLKFMKVMKYLRKMNNFNSYLALLSALDSAPISRLDKPKQIGDGIKEFSTIIDSSAGFRIYRNILAETQPPCIPYLGLVLQDLTFVHIGNSDLLPDGNINFSKRWQQYHILENMKRFSKAQYTFKKNEKIIAMFNGFDDILNEEAMWQISESIKPRGGKKNN